MSDKSTNPYVEMMKNEEEKERFVDFLCEVFEHHAQRVPTLCRGCTFAGSCNACFED